MTEKQSKCTEKPSHLTFHSCIIYHNNIRAPTLFCENDIKKFAQVKLSINSVKKAIQMQKNKVYQICKHAKRT